MTRFARAKGSKAANERRPEEATPWLKMRQQMLEARKLKSKEEIGSKLSPVRENDNVTAEWAQFENPNKKRKLDEEESYPRKKIATMATKRQDFSSPNLENFVNDQAFIEDKSSEKIKDIEEPDGKTRKKRRKDVRIKIKKLKQKEDFSKVREVSNKVVGLKTDLSTHSRGNKLESQQQKISEDKKTNRIANRQITKTMNRGKMEAMELPFKHKKKKGVIGNAVVELNVNNNQGEKILKSQRSKKSHNKKTDHMTSSLSTKKTRAEKEAAELPFMRKKSEQVTNITIDGREVEIRLFDGFPVMKDDWERLTQLKKKMVTQGIPKNEIMAAMKLERRRAEKALARERKKVCFNCRQSGHLLSDCPEVDEGSGLLSNSIGSGICFKCGSTEHKQYECRVTLQDNFKFAKCFVCGEVGHISRQCPDNPRGLYPKGGGCRICGDVTHLKKDCPQEQQQKEENTIKLETLDASGALEALDLHENKSSSGNRFSKAKHIKFV